MSPWRVAGGILAGMTTLAAIFEHNRWANEQLLEACRDLTPEQLATRVEGTYGGLGETLAHIVSGETFYVELLTEWAPAVHWHRADPFPGIDALLSRARDTGARLLAAAESLMPEQPIERDEGEWIPASVILVQAINHATEHRVHAATILSQLGIEPPQVDGWHFGGFE
jgi:uncharacterized damage-inducible protein DinB